jgi:hypothetical protein
MYQWLIDHLAKFPGRVILASFLAAAIVTLLLTLADGDTSPTAVIGMVATLWALFFGVMIYLLTARDTDTVLDQIADLKEQLATALSSPEDAAAADEAAAESATPDDVSSATPEPDSAERPSAGAEPETGSGQPSTSPAPAHRPDGSTPARRPGFAGGHETERAGGGAPFGGTFGGARVLDGSEAIVAGVDPALVEVWESSTGRPATDLTRAWSRDPRSDRQWVFEAGDRRWVVYSRGGRHGMGVISLDDAGRGGRPSRPGRR